MRFAREARPFVLPFVLLTGVLVVFGLPWWSLGSAVVALAVLLFFRDPKRTPGGDERAVLSAADGLITRVEEVEEDPEIGPGRFRRVVTFLSVFDVHVQKVPVAGRVIASRYTPGRKVAAFREDAGEVNEQHLTVLERPDGDRIGVRQIAGLLARRVVCSLGEGASVGRAEPMGLIKFGSRVDVLVPASYRVTVAKGDRVKNGETVIALPADAAEPPGTED